MDHGDGDVLGVWTDTGGIAVVFGYPNIVVRTDHHLVGAAGNGGVWRRAAQRTCADAVHRRDVYGNRCPETRRTVCHRIQWCRGVRRPRVHRAAEWIVND